MMCSIARLMSGLGLAALSVLPGRLAAQSGFEGVATFRTINSDGKADTMVQTTKGRSFRIEGMGSHGGAMIYDADQKRFIMLEPKEKKAVVMTEQDAQQMRQLTHSMADAARQKYGNGAGSKEDVDDTKLDFSKTGKTEVVAGARCEVWHGSTVHEGKKREGEACIADGVGFAMFNLLESNPIFAPTKQPKWVEEYRKTVGPNKGILKIVTYEGGSPRTEMEAIKIDRRSVGADAFQPPAGYTVQMMSDMMQKMQQGMQQMQQQMKNKQQEQGKPPSQ